MSPEAGRTGIVPGGMINLLPEWMRSARFRITILYSTVLFLIAAALLGTLYFALLRSLQSDEPLYKRYGFITIERGGDRLLGGRIVDASEFERQVNQHALETLREFSFGALGVLFVVSLGVGWVISGRVLSPIDRITSVANEIQATDLSRRIDLGGPADELRRLADTFDGMLGRLDAAFDAQRRFIADASHELRNPIAVMRTNIDVVLADPHASKEDLRHAATVVQSATDRMRRLVDDLLALARLEAPSALKEPVDLGGVVSEAVEELRAVASARAVSIAVVSAAGARAAGDGVALKRALVNLIDNALRFGPAGTRVVVGSGHRDPWVWIAVADEGPGIDPDYHEQVFERFWRADKGRSRALGGSGLGLAIVRQIAEGHGGAVRVYSAPGAGAIFVLWLPPLGAERAPSTAEIPGVSPLAPARAFGAPFASHGS